MSPKTSFFLLLSFVSVVLAGAGTKQMRKQDLPGLVDVASLFSPVVAANCKVDISPISAPTQAKPCSCSDVAIDVTATAGPFAPTTCFRITTLEAVTVQLRVTCADKNMNVLDPASLRLVITDAAPTCRNYTVAVSPGRASYFFLLASDPDDDYFEYHVRSASWTTMKGTLKFCLNCDSDKIDQNNGEWKLYSTIAEDPAHRFYRMFSYTPPSDATITVGWNENISFTARDLSDQSCPSDGLITFLYEDVSAPTVAVTRAAVEFSRPTVVRIDTSGASSPLMFTLSSGSDCLQICRLPEAARVILRDFPGEPLSGSILEPCTESNALKPGSDITVFSSKPTFWNSTFVVVKAISRCDQTQFGVTASYDAKSSAVAQQVVTVISKTRHCVSYAQTFNPGALTRISVGQFLATNAGETVKLTTLTTGEFTLQIQGAPLRETSATEQSELSFIGTKSVGISVYVKVNDAELFCTLQLTSRDSPPTPVTPTPVPVVAPVSPAPTPAATSDAFETPGASSAQTTFILVLICSGIVLAYYFRAKIVRFFLGAPAAGAPRRYGVVSGDAGDD
ncbi:membrane-associated protein, putative [Bodo saltans]|uniref:Membrane-associated protein, putative n=1 Tax=Bodo saltans TaxID=75058 RepID=A0A0S4IR66_BODSA|nr:membrane-associated protein, putative [Bodo saltans]|eukprot:CUF26021.1 membrane-associated protein, putative [Bodo saltans]